MVEVNKFRSKTMKIPMRSLKEMKRQAYAMGNMKEIQRINKIIAFYTGKKLPEPKKNFWY